MRVNFGSQRMLREVVSWDAIFKGEDGPADLMFALEGFLLGFGTVFERPVVGRGVVDASLTLGEVSLGEEYGNTCDRIRAGVKGGSRHVKAQQSAVLMGNVSRRRE